MWKLYFIGSQHQLGYQHPRSCKTKMNTELQAGQLTGSRGEEVAQNLVNERNNMLIFRKIHLLSCYTFAKVIPISIKYWYLHTYSEKLKNQISLALEPITILWPIKPIYIKVIVVKCSIVNFILHERVIKSIYFYGVSKYFGNTFREIELNTK